MTAKLRILWLSDSPLVATGFGRVTKEVCSRLARSPDFQVACLGWGFDGWPYDTAAFPVRIYPSAASSFGQDTFERVVEHFQPHVVITLGEMWMVQWLHTHPARSRFKWIAYFPIDGAPMYPPWEPVVRDADEVVAMSAFGKSVLQAGVPAKRIHLIHHGVDTSVFRPLEDRTALKKHPRFLGKFVIGCVARNQPRKNLPALVKAFASLAFQHADLHLYLHMDACDVGYDMVTLLRRYHLEGRADISNPDFSIDRGLSDVQLNRLYNLFDISVLPSTGEGFGLPIVESFAARIPVVATDCSACTELVGGRGELVRVLATMTMGTNLIEQAIIDVDDLAECIARLYLNPDRVRTYGEAGREFAKTLAWENLMPKWLEVIQLASGRELDQG